MLKGRIVYGMYSVVEGLRRRYGINTTPMAVHMIMLQSRRDPSLFGGIFSYGRAGGYTFLNGGSITKATIDVTHEGNKSQLLDVVSRLRNTNNIIDIMVQGAPDERRKAFFKSIRKDIDYVADKVEERVRDTG
jgi:hypothetical protein